MSVSDAEQASLRAAAAAAAGGAAAYSCPAVALLYMPKRMNVV